MTRARLASWPGVARGLFFFLTVIVSGCSRDMAKEPGVVAVVAGSPIRLADVQARYDLGEIGAPETENPPVAQLRSEYGAVLADMIVAKLVRQELARLHESITAAELAAAEGNVRADYPGDSFAGMLLEERIDLARWREVLCDRLALEKFTRRVLRQNVRVDVTEAANYYKQHIEAFARPARLRLARVQGGQAEAVKAALAAYRKAGQQASGLASLAGVTIREADLPEKNLPPLWREAVKGLNPGEASGLLSAGPDSLFLVVLERQPATVLDPAKAYSRVEAILAGQKLEKAFAAWLAETLGTARIMVNKELLAGVQPEKDRAPGKAAPGEPALAREKMPAQAEPAETAQKALSEKSAAPRASAAAVADTAPAATGTGSQTPSPGPGESPPAALPNSTPAPRPPAAPAPAGQAPSEAPGKAVAAPDTPDTKDAKGTEETGSPQEKQPAPAPAPERKVPEAAPAQAAGAAQTAGGEAEFTAVKASWILYTVDGGQEQRVYLKPGKPQRIAFAQKLSVRLGSPSEVTYRQGNRQETVVVGKKESRILDFP